MESIRKKTASLPPALVSALLCTVIFVLAAWIRWQKLSGLSLWYDDLQAVTFADRPFPFTILSVLTYDCHPPLYYLFLKLWLYLGRSDTVILLSSFLLSLASVILLYFVVKKRYGEKHAVISSLILAIHPTTIFWSHFARMYSLLMLLCILSFHANHLLLDRENPTRRHKAYLILAELGVIYSHVAGFFFMFFQWLYFYLQTAGHKEVRRRWIRLHVLVGLLGALALHFPLSQGSLGHMRLPGLDDILFGLSLHVTGPVFRSGPWVILGATLVTLLVVVLSLGKRQGLRWHALIFVCGPLLLAALVSYTVKPMWHGVRTFSFFIPMTAVGLSLAFFPDRKNRVLTIASRLTVLALTAVMVCGTVQYNSRFEKTGLFAPVVRYLAKNGQPGDLVVVDGIRVAMSLNWYLLGPEWDSTMSAEVFSDWPEQCTGLKAPKCLVQRIRQFDSRPRGTKLQIVVAKKRHIDIDTTKYKRVWTLSRKKKNIKELEKSLGMRWKIRESQEISRLILVLYQVEEPAHAPG